MQTSAERLPRYVVQAVSLSLLAPSSSASTSLSSPAPFPRPEPSVLIGIFPAAVVHVRPSDITDDKSLSTAYEDAVRLAEGKSRNGPSSHMGEMEAVEEEDEDAMSPGRSEGPVINIAPSGQLQSLPATSGMGRANRPKSLVLDPKGLGGKEEDKAQPPLPRLTAGDSTDAGQNWPLIDEIACAIREWYEVSDRCLLDIELADACFRGCPPISPTGITGSSRMSHNT